MCFKSFARGGSWSPFLYITFTWFAITYINIKPCAHRVLPTSDKGEPAIARAEAKVTNASSFNKPVVVAKKSPVPFIPKTIEVSVDGGTAAIQLSLIHI